jgi:hypothetical protein
MRPRARVASGVASLALLITAFFNPLPASAHVNRTVGPYAFFLVLIEEPFYDTNRAGFEFWVHDAGRSVEGLDRSLNAVATSSTQEVGLRVSPINDRGFYDVESDLTGRPFDPGDGGDWTLRLTGTVEDEPVDVSFPTTFPAYPRVSTALRRAAPRDPDGGPDVWLLVDAGLVLAAVTWLGLKVRRRRRAASPGG